MEKSNKRVGDHLLVIWKRKWLILLLLGLGTGGALAYALNQPPTYSYTMTVRIAQRGGPAGFIDGDLASLAGLFDQKNYSAYMLDILASDFTKEQMYKNRIEKALNPAQVPEFLRPDHVGKAEALRFLKDAVNVGLRSRGSSLVDIKVEGPNPDSLRWIAENYWQEFVQMQELIRSADIEKSAAHVKHRRDDAQRKHVAADSSLQEWLKNASTTPKAIERQVETLAERVAARERELYVLKGWLAENRKDYQEIKTAYDKKGEAALHEFFQTLIVTSLQPILDQEWKVNQIGLELQKALKTFNVGADRVKDLSSEQDQARFVLVQLKYAALLNFVRAYENAQEKETALASDIEKTKAEAAKYERLHEELVRKQGDVESTHAEYERYRDQFEKVLNFQLNQDNTSLQVSMTPDVDRTPIAPNVPLITIGGLIFGLVIGVGLAFGLELLDDSLRTEDDVDRFLQLPCLGVVHAPESRRGGDAAVDLASVIEPRSIFAEEFRSIRTSLGFTFDRRRERHYSMMVTSFEVREGKSTVSTNLSTVIAASGLRTLLVDADMRNPRIHRTFQLENDAGLSDVLRGAKALDEVVQSTDIPHLSVLPAGRIPENPAELLEGPSMRKLLEELAEKYDRVVFDTPPAGAVTDPMVLGKVVDASILVAAAGRAKKRYLKRVVKNMRSIGVRIAGVIINEMRPGRKRYYRKYFHLYSARPEERNIG